MVRFTCCFGGDSSLLHHSRKRSFQHLTLPESPPPPGQDSSIASGPSNQPAGISDLISKDALQEIFSYLDIHDVVQAMMVCKDFRAAAGDIAAWRYHPITLADPSHYLPSYAWMVHIKPQATHAFAASIKSPSDDFIHGNDSTCRHEQFRSQVTAGCSNRLAARLKRFSYDSMHGNLPQPPSEQQVCSQNPAVSATQDALYSGNPRNAHMNLSNSSASPKFSLHILDASNSGLQPHQMQHMSTLTNLFVLKLAGNHLRPSAIKHFTNLQQLRCLDLSGNHLGLGSVHVSLAPLSQLQALDISNNKLKPDSVASLLGTTYASATLSATVTTNTVEDQSCFVSFPPCSTLSLPVSAHGLPASHPAACITPSTSRKSSFDASCSHTTCSAASSQPPWLSESFSFLRQGVNAAQHHDVTCSAGPSQCASASRQSSGCLTATDSGHSCSLTAADSAHICSLTAADSPHSGRLNAGESNHMGSVTAADSAHPASNSSDADSAHALDKRGSCTLSLSSTMTYSIMPESLSTCPAVPEMNSKESVPGVCTSQLVASAPEANGADHVGLMNLNTLRASNNLLTASAVRHIAQLTGLYELDISSNYIGMQGLAQLSSLSQLVSLNVSDNQISGWPGCLAGLTTLKSLDISDNTLQVEGMSPLVGLTGLTELIMHNCQLQAAGLAPVASLTNLLVLDLHGNRIGSAALQYLSSLKRLQVLDITNTNTGAMGAYHLSHLTSLTTLNISSNPLQAAVLQHLLGLTQLKVLRMGKATLVDDDMVYVSSVTSLTHLELWGNRFGSPVLQHLTNLTNLRTLNLESNCIGREQQPSLDQLGRLTSVRSLNLAQNRLRPNAIPYLAQLRNLESLNVGYNQLGCDCSAYLLTSLSSLDALVDLNVAANDLGPHEAMHLASLTGLESLDVGMNQLGTQGLKCLTALTRLKSLGVWQNKLGVRAVKSLLSIKGLTRLDVSHNRWPRGSVQELQSGLPASCELHAEQ